MKSVILSEKPRIEFILGDCMEYMATLPDKAFELAIVDPPYGIGESGGKCRTRKKHNNRVKHTKKKWDNERPSAKYWNKLFRVSKNQIVWGANYFTKHLPASMGWIFWDKKIGGDFSDGELAYTSFNKALKMITEWNGGYNGIPRIHPTQKPVTLYNWILHKYAKQGDRILDTHGGSFSSAIACFYAGYDFVGIELDEDYFNLAIERFKKETRQNTLLDLIGEHEKA